MQGAQRTKLLAGASCMLAVLGACSSTSKAAAKKDVTITACTPSKTGGHPSAGGSILNHSSQTSLYTIHVKFADSAGNGVGDGVAVVARVDSGTTATWHASGTLDAKGKVTCSLSSVTRNRVP